MTDLWADERARLDFACEAIGNAAVTLMEFAAVWPLGDLTCVRTLGR
jgi:hypothetical protein